MQFQFPRTFRVACHTARVGPSTIFVAIPGTNRNGNDFVPRAIRLGASRIVLQYHSDRIEKAAAAAHAADIPVDYVACARKALAEYSAHAYGYPQSRMYIIGVTGTKGKTTTVSLIYHILRWAGISAALMSSAGNGIHGHRLPPSLTTAQPDYLHAFLHEACIHGVTHVVMEVAAQALTLYRVSNIAFDVAIITNVSHEHGEFYQSYASYIEAKRSIIDHTHDQSCCILNADDECVSRMQTQRITRIACGFTSNIASPAHIVSQPDEPINIQHVSFPCSVSAPMYGTASAYNLLMAVSATRECGVPWSSIINACRHFPGVPGRMEKISLCNGAVACLDYAHNIASLEHVLSTLRARYTYIILVFGASGERDRSKREPMARIACRYADMMIITRDNPRSEPIDQIMYDVWQGIDTTRTTVYEIRDRAQAITWACRSIPSHGAVAVLGKGHDDYQIIQGTVYPHSDYATLMQFA